MSSRSMGPAHFSDRFIEMSEKTLEMRESSGSLSAAGVEGWIVSPWRWELRRSSKKMKASAEC